jgi:anti-sigma factor RsiW
MDPRVRVESSPAGSPEEAQEAEGLVTDREKLTQALEERDHLAERVEELLRANRVLNAQLDSIHDYTNPDPNPARARSSPRPADGEAAP